MPRLSAIIITRNEASNIGDCLDSLAFCDERIVVDSDSTDGTLLIAREKGARIATHGWKGFGPQKNYALSLEHGDWVLSIDTDDPVHERVVGEGRTARLKTALLHYPVAPLEDAIRRIDQYSTLDAGKLDA